MTRADKSPVRRIVDDRWVVEINGDGINIRPLRSRRNGPAHKGLKAGALYVHLCWRDGAKKRKAKPSRNLLRRDG